MKGTPDLDILFEHPDEPPKVVLLWLAGTGDAASYLYKLSGTNVGVALRSMSVLVVCPRYTGP